MVCGSGSLAYATDPAAQVMVIIDKLIDLESVIVLIRPHYNNTGRHSLHGTASQSCKVVSTDSVHTFFHKSMN